MKQTNERKENQGMRPRGYRELQANGMLSLELDCPFRARLPERTDADRERRRPKLDRTTERLHGALRGRVTDFAFTIWIEPLRVIDSTRDGELFVEAPAHLAGWVRVRYAPLIAEAAAELAGRPIAVLVVAAPRETTVRPVVAEPTGAAA